MNKISIYMLKKYLLGFVLAITVLLGINLLVMLISELKNVGNHDYTLTILFTYILYLIPQNILDVFPYALLIGSMASFGSMAYHSEFIALNSHGVGIKRTMSIVIIQTFLIAVVLTVITNSIAPKYSNDAQTLKNISLNKGLSDKTIWFKSKDYIVNVKRIITDVRLENIVIYNLSNGELSNTLTAEEGKFINNKWEFSNVKFHNLLTNEITQKDHYDLSAMNFIPFEILKSQFNKKRYISIQDLYRNINFHNKMAIPYENHKVVFWKKILLPFSCCIIVFVGLPFLFTRMRSTNQSKRLIFGVLFGITYFVITSIITNMAVIIGLPAFLSVIISMFFFIVMGVYLFNILIRKDIPI